MEPVEIDIIILSYAQNNDLKQTTLNCIHSLLNSEDINKVKFNIIVLESERILQPYQYFSTMTVYPTTPFGYNKYMNIGLQMSSSSFVCLCNNDLLFHPLWASEILRTFSEYPYIVSASPFCSIFHPTLGYNVTDGIKFGYGVRDIVTGWCLFFRRNILTLTGKLDENYNFWAADNDYANTLGVLNLKHCLVTSSVVDHLENRTLNYQTQERQEELTKKESIYFYKKWGPRLGGDWLPI